MKGKDGKSNEVMSQKLWCYSLYHTSTVASCSLLLCAHSPCATFFLETWIPVTTLYLHHKPSASAHTVSVFPELRNSSNLVALGYMAYHSSLFLSILEIYVFTFGNNCIHNT